jgi:fructose-1,6-bisphosphatase/inositol monophosphatase family enzyme
MTHDISELLGPIQRLHQSIQASVVEACVKSEPGELFRIDRDTEGDTIYAIDRISEDLLVEFFEQEIASRAPLVLIAEGIEQGKLVLPKGSDERDAVWRIIVDPIDGTRALMYQKRSAWILTGVAPNRGPETSLKDIELAVQTEIPLVKQHLADSLWAIRDCRVGAERLNRLTGERTPMRMCPSNADTIAHGFAMVARFFPGAREELAAIDEEIVIGALGPVRPGKAHCFEDQYLSTAGQLYELMAGHDRFVADLRPLMEQPLAAQGKALGICCHPYDLCTELIARELGVIVTGARGEPLDARLSTEPDVAWVGYANKAIRAQMEPLLQRALSRRGLIDLAIQNPDARDQMNTEDHV